MTSECLVRDSFECIAKELVIHSSSGDDYVVASDSTNVNNTFFSLCYGESAGESVNAPERNTTVAMVFNRLVVPSEITDIDFEAHHSIISDEDFGGAALTLPSEPTAEGAKAPTEAENPFSFLRDDGIFMWVLTKDTIEGCSEDDLKNYACFVHGYGQFDELIADRPNAANLADREYMLSEISGRLNGDMMTADEAVDMYLGLLDRYYPGEREKLIYIYLRLDDNGDGTCSWRFAQTNIEALHDANINANTRKLVYPIIPGLNG